MASKNVVFIKISFEVKKVRSLYCNRSTGPCQYATQLNKPIDLLFQSCRKCPWDKIR